MRKMVLMVAVMMIAAPAMADISFAVTDNTDGTFTVSYTTTNGDLPRGVAIKVTVDGYNITGSNSQMSAFNANIDYLYTNNGAGLGDGHAMAKDAIPGEFGFDGSVAVISVGVLDTGGNQGAGPASGDLITIVTSMGEGDSATVTLTADGLRGPSTGVVGSVIESNLDDTDPAVTNVVITYPVTYTGCFPQAHPDFGQWVAVGVLLGMNGEDEGPECWCGTKISTDPDVWESYQCYGNADNALDGSPMSGYFAVGGPDLTTLLEAWGILNAAVDQDDSNDVPFVCADFDHTQYGSPMSGYFRVGGPDLTILLNNWGNTGLTPDCLD